MRRAGLIGFSPYTLELAVVDVDAGNPTELIRKHPPLFTARTEGTHKGLHLYYNDPDGGRDCGKWEAYGCSGEIRRESGYVILWPEAWKKLCTWIDNRSYNNPLPLEFIQEKPLEIPDNRQISRPDGLSQEKGTVRLHTVAEGGRNVALFHALRFWAYLTIKATKEIPRDILEVATGMNRHFPEPLPDNEVKSIVESIIDFCHDRYFPQIQKGAIGLRNKSKVRDPEKLLKRIREATSEELSEWGRKGGKIGGRKSGESRRKKTYQRDMRILSALYIEGRKRRDVAKEFDLSERAISKIKNRFPGITRENAGRNIPFGLQKSRNRKPISVVLGKRRTFSKNNGPLTPFAEDCLKFFMKNPGSKMIDFYRYHGYKGYRSELGEKVNRLVAEAMKKKSA